MNKQNEETWRKKAQKWGADYDGPPDHRADDWVESFVARVGRRAAGELLFGPLDRRNAFVRSKLQNNKLCYKASNKH